MRLLTVDVAFTGAFSTVARTGSSASGIWNVAGFPDRARTADAAYLSTTLGPMAGATRKTEHLQGVGFTTPSAAKRYPIHRIGVKVTADAGSGAGDTTDVRTDDVHLVKAGVILTSVDAGDATTARQWGGVETKTYWFTLANLETLGVTRADLQNNPADFGAAIGFLEDDSAGSYGLFAVVDYLGLVFEYLVDDEDMDYFAAGQRGGWKPLLTEAIPTVSSSAQIFANAPVGTQLIWIDIRGQDLYLETDGTAASATAGSGIPLYAGGHYWLSLNKSRALNCRAIQAGATTTGTIMYFALES